ncbi:MAG TPA: GH25 family lysozyme [Thermoanaerobaculia bacterium]|nr:GH25 family lysozyme [Thermoanaerobaculia bacterium]
MTERTVRVVDLYHGDRVSSFAKAAAAGVWGVIHKATTGATGRDEKYATRRARVRAAGLLWGAYHWGTHADVQKQIDNFLLIADPDEDTLVALDFEETAGNQMTLAQARDFLGGVAEKIGRKPVLYSGHLIKDSLGGTVDPFFGGQPLARAVRRDARCSGELGDILALAVHGQHEGPRAEHRSRSAW